MRSPQLTIAVPLDWQQVGDDLGKRMVTGLLLAPYDTAATPGMVETLLAATSDGIWAVPMPPPFK